MSQEREIQRLAVSQGGVVRREQLTSAGFSERQVSYRVEKGEWSRIGRMGIRIVPMSTGGDLLRAAVAVLPDAVVSHEAALHGMPRLRRGLAVVTVHTRTTHEFPGVVVHRTHDLETGHIVERHSLPTTSIPRTIVDLAAFLHPEHLGAIVDDLVACGRVRLEEIVEVAKAVARRGKPGSRALREVIEVGSEGEWVKGSVLERRGRLLLVRNGLPRPVPEFPFPWNPSRRFDDAYPDARIAIEWDSRRWHSQVKAADSDRKRDQEAAAHGWRTIRFSWFDVTRRANVVIDTVRQALSQQTVG